MRHRLRTSHDGVFNMTTTTCGRFAFCKRARAAARGAPRVDRRVALAINGASQRLRLCAAREGLPPVLIVQAGPGLPLLNEVAKFQRRLDLERDFSVCYWDPRGCGTAAARTGREMSLAACVDDARVVARWLQRESGQRVAVLGISLGATIALQAAIAAEEYIKALVAVSIDADTAASDAAAAAFLQRRATTDPSVTRLIGKLGPPPYPAPAQFQLRARLLTELGAIEHGRRFRELLRELLVSLLRTYGPWGAVKAIRNMNIVQRRMLPALASLNLFDRWPCPGVPIHYVFGAVDPFSPASVIEGVGRRLRYGDTMTVAPAAGHMTHFDQPALVRSLLARAHDIL